MTMAERTRTSLRRRTLLAVALAAIGFAGTANAQPSTDLLGLTVVDRDTGQPLRVWRQGGRLFVAGQPGTRYSLRVTNHTDGRVLAVMSVDGVNILTGETAGYDQRGYVFGPRETYDIGGWRKSDSEIAAFTFAALPQSYAARTGRPGDVGVIGVAAFRERIVAPIAVAPARSPAQRSRPNASLDELVVTAQSRAAPVAAPPPAAGRTAASEPSDVVVTAERRTEKLGTAHGAREWSQITIVPFERATAYPQLIRRIEYDTWENLAANGVIPRPRGPGPRPRPFPSSGDGAGYVPDPPGRF